MILAFSDDSTTVFAVTIIRDLAPDLPIIAAFLAIIGYSLNDTIVVYDGPGFFSAPRVWWMFRAMGARDVHVLEGSFDGWKAEGRPVTGENTNCAGCYFKTAFDPANILNPGKVVDLSQEESP